MKTNKENIQSTGIYSVDMVLNCIDHYRSVKKPIKRITLNTYHWSKFKSFFDNKISDNDERKYNDMCEYIIDGVTISRYLKIPGNFGDEDTYIPEKNEIAWEFYDNHIDNNQFNLNGNKLNKK